MIIEKLTILHISDLHRSSNNPISNVSLQSSLLRDIDKYEEEGISKPDLIIVSGDIVQGSNNFDEASSILSSQYEEAYDFLTNLADELFDGNRNRIIIVPGNHDVCWSESKNSMKKFEDKEVLAEQGELKPYFLKEMVKVGSNIKWSWKERSFYRIENIDLYNERFKYFSDFYKRFYNFEKSYSLDPKEQYDIFDFPEWGISIIGLNSCYHNDHLNRTGAINSDCIASVALKLRKLKNDKRLLLATWHHNTNGGPNAQDYMDNTILQNFIADEIKLGFHGHQHKSEIIRAENNIIENKKMIILSAGSICAGPNELPSGYKQQFNILELFQKTEACLELKVYSREKTLESSYENPIWQKGLFNSSEPCFTTELEHNKQSTNSIKVLQKAEKMVGEEDYESAIDILIGLNKKEEFVRTLLLTCYIELDKNLEIIQDFMEPKNNAEAIALMNACLEENNKIYINKIYNNEYIQKSIDPIIQQFKKKLEVKL